MRDWDVTLLALAAVGWTLLGVWQVGLVCAVLALAYARTRRGRA